MVLRGETRTVCPPQTNRGQIPVDLETMKGGEGGGEEFGGCFLLRTLV